MSHSVRTGDDAWHPLARNVLKSRSPTRCAAAARIAQQLARHELVSGGTASLDRAARCGKMLRRKVDFKLSFYFHTRNVTERVFNT